MPKGYVILTEAIKDQEAMDAYSRASARALIDGRAKVLSVDTRPEVLEGGWHGDRTVVLEFESVEAARAWYESDAYGEARPLRLAAADSNVVILSGFEFPS
ncbi:DUF1330 domain-containing protein [Actinomadura sp. WMMB 499]|uniref:DUF1330 domain-containing protein n=1 Tax=Actinomadura sp. WMMB 499 TaxID=1219491 RepID=UPI001243ADAE|nr:DUF1330 domain-containing protein [Actinomadura sp. WMMB 499]QFG20666.1 DUF1330 domain-containing protein [Actinomadura sp. WMMB 499]